MSIHSRNRRGLGVGACRQEDLDHALVRQAFELAQGSVERRLAGARQSRARVCTLPQKKLA